jgi:hypothetical protein
MRSGMLGRDRKGYGLANGAIVLLLAWSYGAQEVIPLLLVLLLLCQKPK